MKMPPVREYASSLICDMIKGNESDVGNIDFELQAKRGDKGGQSFMFFIVFKLQRMFASPQIDV